MSLRRVLAIFFGICSIPIWLSACNRGSPQITSTAGQTLSTVTPTVSPESSSTPVPPTATPVPMAAIINGEGITLAEFQAEVTRYQSVITGTILASDTYTIVMNELIDQTILAQAAKENDYVVDDGLVQSRIDALQMQLGGEQALIDWQSTHGYSPEEFVQALRRAIGAAWMRDQITATVPETADQVHVFQILVPSSGEAEQVYSRLVSGEDFLDIASSYDPLTKGDLGWLPRGYLTDPKIEEAAFALQPGQYSQVIQDEVGYHVLYLLAREADYPLSADARRSLQEKTIQDWLTTRKDQSEIQILVP